MDQIDWSSIQPGIPTTIELQYKGRNCIAVIIKEYKNSPWFLSSSQVAPTIDILSSDGNFVGVFDIPDPAVVEDDVAFFKGIAACLQFLASRHLALTEVNMKTFCKSNDKHQVCKLSPHCLVMADPDGSQLTENRKDIFRLWFFRPNSRFEHALLKVKNVEDLARHPATWTLLEGFSLLFQAIAFADKKHFNVNSAIKLRGNIRNWAIDPKITDDFKKQNMYYDTSSFWDLLRFIRNKLAHFKDNDPVLLLFDKSPAGIIEYFNKHVLKNGDLIYTIWDAINSKETKLSHFWIN